MKIHYFQRYHEKENVATANTMLLLSRLYSYSSDKFFRFLKSEFFSDSFEPEIVFNLQEKSVDSIPDATITQEGFKIVVETKMSDWFYSDQLIRHLKSFGDEKYKVIITLAPEFMSVDKKADFEKILNEYNALQTYPIIHINTTFEQLANAVQDVLNEYVNYCRNDGLITVSDAWRYMRMPLSGATFDFNVKNNIYYCNIDRGFRPHEYVGLYKNKSVRAIGKICAVITAERVDSEIEYKAEMGELTEERKDTVRIALEDKESHGWYDQCRYFIVEKFMTALYI